MSGAVTQRSSSHGIRLPLKKFNAFCLSGAIRDNHRLDKCHTACLAAVSWVNSLRYAASITVLAVLYEHDDAATYPRYLNRGAKFLDQIKGHGTPACL